MPTVLEMPRPVRTMHILGSVSAACAFVAAVTGLSTSIANCADVQTVGMMIVGALSVTLTAAAMLMHIRIRRDCSAQRASVAGGLSLGALVCTIAATVYYNIYFTNYYYYDDDYVYNDDWEDYSVCRVSVIFFGVATTCNIIAAVAGLVLRRRIMQGGAAYAPLVYGQGGTTVVTTAHHGYHQQPQQPGYYQQQPSYPGQMPPPPSYDQQGQYPQGQYQQQYQQGQPQGQYPQQQQQQQQQQQAAAEPQAPPQAAASAPPPAYGDAAPTKE